MWSRVSSIFVIHVFILLVPLDAVASGPAIASANGTAGISIQAAGNRNTDTATIEVGATFFTPMTDALGLGLGAGGGRFFETGRNAGTINGSVGLFWRDPDEGFMGFAASGIRVEKDSAWDTSIIGGAYLGKWELVGSAGQIGGDRLTVTVFGVEFGFYPGNQVRIGLGGSAGTEEYYTGDLTVDLQFFSNRSNFLLQLAAGAGSLRQRTFYATGLSIIYQFGERKPLLRQLREDRL